jgi:ABC-2 type transport system permease protein
VTVARFDLNFFSMGRRRLLSSANVIHAFVRIGVRTTMSYPLGFALVQLSSIVQVFGFVFLQKIIGHSAALGSNYLTFGSIGLAASQLSLAGIVSLGQELDWTIQQGRLEMLLVQPIPWRLIPVALAAWPTLYRTAMAIAILFTGWGLGAVYSPSQLPEVAILLLLGVASGLAIGIAAGSLRVLAKRGDPIASVYTLTAYLLTGQFIPLNLLPLPLRVFGWLYPQMYLTSGLRKSLEYHSGHIYGPSGAQAILALLAMTAIFLPLALWLFGRSLETGRRYGVLAGY